MHRQFLTHRCFWLALKGGVQEGRVTAILETGEKISAFHTDQVQQVWSCCCPFLASLWSSPLTPYCVLRLTAAEECLQENQARTTPKGCVLGNVICNVSFRFAFSSYLTHSDLCSVTPYGISYYSSSCVSAVI